MPTSYPTIAQQVALFTDPPSQVSTILVNGGLNDLDIRTVLNPTTSTDQITTGLEDYCHRDMLKLLNRLADAFANARIIVLGYYPILSDQSNLTLLEVFCMAAGLRLAGIPGAIVGGVVTAVTKQHIVRNCQMLVDVSTEKLRQAVDEANALLTTPRIAFAESGIGAANAALTADPFLFGIDADLSPEDAPEVAGPRAEACTLAGSERTNVEQCKRASVGHPNSRGAEVYAASIVQQL